MSLLPTPSKATIGTMPNIDNERQWIFMDGYFGIKVNKHMTKKHKEMILNAPTRIDSAALEQLLNLPTTATRMRELTQLEVTKDARIGGSDLILQKFTFTHNEQESEVWLNRQYLAMIGGNIAPKITLWIEPERPTHRVYIMDNDLTPVAVIMPVLIK